MSDYSRDDAIAEFFQQTCATRASCDRKAEELVGGEVVPVQVQGVCSYSVYAGLQLNYVVQFRLQSLKLNIETVALARQVYGPLSPTVTFHGKLDPEEDEADKEPLLVYVMDRVRGLTHLDFVLKYGFPHNSGSNFAARKNLMGDIARFMARSWNAPQEVSSEFRGILAHKYTSDLQLLLNALPDRFQSVVQAVIDSLESVLSLPMVLLHRDFGTSNILVDGKTCHLAGVVDWAEAEVCPFGQNLHSLEAFTGRFHIQHGWIRYEDYEELQDMFWSTFAHETSGGLNQATKKAIETSRVMGLLLSRGFTTRLANATPPTPISDDDAGSYNMKFLDGLLLQPETRFINL